MKVKDIMTSEPATGTPPTSLHQIARLMVENDCGAIPVVSTDQKPMGITTDRDITTRAVAEGRNPLEMTAADCMTTPCVTVTPDMTVDECTKVMEQHQIRRVVVVDAGGRCVGIVAQADIARHASKKETGEVVKEVSESASQRARELPRNP